MSQEIWVKEMPKCCAECEHCTKNHKDNYGIPYCLIARMPLYNGSKIYEERGQHKNSLSDFDCPLKSLHDNNKELVAKVLRKAKSLITKYDLLKDYNSCAGYFMLDKIIDQIQKEFEK